MRLVKKWLFPVLTCLIVAGAAVLPPYISQVRDRRQFGRVYAETLDADASLPAAPSSTLLDRMMLYVDRYSMYCPVLSSEGQFYFDDSEGETLAQAAQERLTEAGVLPNWIFEEDPFDRPEATRILLWNPEEAELFREPAVFWSISWPYSGDKSHAKSIRVTEDAETGLPIHIWVHDTNMSQWLPYDTDCLRTLAAHYFDLMGLEVREAGLDGEPLSTDIGLQLRYEIAGSRMGFYVTRNPTVLTIALDLNWRSRTDTDPASSGYDG